MKRLTLTNKTHYAITDVQQDAILQAIDTGAKYVVIQGDVLMLASIVGIQEESLFDEVDHRQDNQYKCVHNQWHPRGERCYGHDPVLPASPQMQKLADHRQRLLDAQ